MGASMWASFFFLSPSFLLSITSWFWPLHPPSSPAFRPIYRYWTLLNHTSQGHLDTYRFCDEVWTFILKDVKFKLDNSQTIEVDKVRIVSCESRKRGGQFLISLLTLDASAKHQLCKQCTGKEVMTQRAGTLHIRTPSHELNGQNLYLVTGKGFHRAWKRRIGNTTRMGTAKTWVGGANSALSIIRVYQFHYNISFM